jgi:hypothetical protein
VEPAFLEVIRATAYEEMRALIVEFWPGQIYRGIVMLQK